MNLGTIVLIILVGIAGYMYFQTDNPPEGDVVNWTSNLNAIPDVGKGENITIYVNNITNTPSKNLCNYTLFGYANFKGTERDGQTCAQSRLGEENSACVQNPPLNYNGVIDKIGGGSNPHLACCKLDGTCQWGRGPA